MRILGALAIVATLLFAGAPGASAQNSPTPMRGPIVPQVYTQGAGDSTWPTVPYGFQNAPDAVVGATADVSRLNPVTNPMGGGGTPPCTVNCGTTPTNATWHWIASLDCTNIPACSYASGGHGNGFAIWRQAWICTPSDPSAGPAAEYGQPGSEKCGQLNPPIDPGSGTQFAFSNSSCQTSRGAGYVYGRQCAPWGWQAS